MSSSYKQKKVKTLVTRKKTRKRRIEEGLTFEDEPGRLFQPPSTRDPRWKKPSIEAVVSGVITSKRRKKAEKKRRKLATNQSKIGDGDKSFELVQQENASSDNEPKKPQTVELIGNDALFELPKTPLRLCSSPDDAVAKAVAQHAEIRRADSRQKKKVLLLVDSRSLFKLVKKKMNIRSEMIKAKSKRGVGSGKKPEMGFKNVGLVKTPLDRYKNVNTTVLKEYMSGKLSSILAEGLSVYPFLKYKVQHVILVAKHASSAINLNRNVLENVQLHSFVVCISSAAEGSENEYKALQAAYDVSTSP